MIVTTTNDVAGYRIVLSVVRGITVVWCAASRCVRAA